jgi:hypothetical protein
MKKGLYEMVTLLPEARAREVLGRIAPELAPVGDPFQAARALDADSRTPSEAFEHLTRDELRSLALAWCKDSAVNNFLFERPALVNLLRGVVADPVNGCP